MKDGISQKIHGNMVLPFPTNMKLPFCQKIKDDLLAKNAPKDDIFGITGKDDAHPR